MSKEMMLDAAATMMENMEINVDAIDEALTPELPDSVAEFVSKVPDKPY